MTKLFSTLSLLLASFALNAQTILPVSIPVEKDSVYGTLVVPEVKGKVPVVLIIAGSGPTDRDGNNPLLKNDAYKQIADSLAAAGIASLRYDKRMIGQSSSVGTTEAELKIDHYIQDAITWVNLLKQDPRFSKVIVVGHSEGSLIGMVAAGRAKANGFISVAGAGKSADQILKQQLEKQAPQLSSQYLGVIDSLKGGHMVKSVNPMLSALFRESVQPYLISWFSIDPQKEMAQLSMPILIVQGTTDIQVTTEEAALLAKAQPKAQLKVISGMNHVLKNAPADLQENIRTYGNPELPLNSEFVQVLKEFMKQFRS